MLKKLKLKFNAWNKQRMLKKAQRLIIKAADQPIGTIGKSAKTGTVFYLKDIFFDVRKNKLDYRYVKLRRGVQTNKHKETL